MLRILLVDVISHALTIDRLMYGHRTMMTLSVLSSSSYLSFNAASSYKMLGLFMTMLYIHVDARCVKHCAPDSLTNRVI